MRVATVGVAGGSAGSRHPVRCARPLERFEDNHMHIIRLVALSIPFALSSCSVFNAARDFLFGQPQKLAFEPADATTLSRAAFDEIDRQVPAAETPRVAIVVRTTEMNEAAEQLSQSDERLQVFVGSAPTQLQQTLTEMARAKNWSVVAPEVLRAACGARNLTLPDAVLLPESRKTLAQVLEQNATGALNSVLFADLSLCQSQVEGNAQFQLHLRLLPVNGDDVLTSQASVDKKLPSSGLLRPTQGTAQAASLQGGRRSTFPAPSVRSYEFRLGRN